MVKLLPVTIFALLFAGLSHSLSDYDPIRNVYIKKERLFYALTTITLILFAGLRTSYNDTDTYKHMYKTVVKELPKQESLFAGIEWSKVGENPGFFAIMRIMAKLNFSTQSYIMVFSIFTIWTNMWFFRRYSCNFFMSVLLFITFAGYIFNLAAIKQCTAMALGLIATDRAINRKYVQFLLLILVAMTIHPYVLMFLVVPFLHFRPWGKSTIVLLVIFAGIGFGMQSLLGTILNVTDMLGESYDAQSFTGEGVNPIRLLVTAVPLFLSLLTVEQIMQNEERDQYMILNLTMLNAEIMFVALFGTANFFARLANYFIPFQAVSMPRLFAYFDMDGKRAISISAAACYMLFFVYSFTINETFDWSYYSVSFWEYLGSLF